MPPLRWPGHGTDPCADRRTHTEPDARKDRGDRTDRETHPGVVARGRLMLVGDLDLAVSAAFEHGGVERVPDTGLLVQAFTAS